MISTSSRSRYKKLKLFLLKKWDSFSQKIDKLLFIKNQRVNRVSFLLSLILVLFLLEYLGPIASLFLDDGIMPMFRALTKSCLLLSVVWLIRARSIDAGFTLSQQILFTGTFLILLISSIIYQPGVWLLVLGYILFLLLLKSQNKTNRRGIVSFLKNYEKEISLFGLILSFLGSLVMATSTIPVESLKVDGLPLSAVIQSRFDLGIGIVIVGFFFQGIEGFLFSATKPKKSNSKTEATALIPKKD